MVKDKQYAKILVVINSLLHEFVAPKGTPTLQKKALTDYCLCTRTGTESRVSRGQEVQNRDYPAQIGTVGNYLDVL